ncbi:8498_t:CDS:2, partial [Diversispora eburnea]
MSKIHEYFNRSYNNWCITGFLNECNKGPFRKKIGIYLKDLEAINDHERGKKQKKAELQNQCCGTEIAKRWEEEHTENRQIHLHQPTFTSSRHNNVNINGITNGGSFVTGLSDRITLNKKETISTKECANNNYDEENLSCDLEDEEQKEDEAKTKENKTGPFLLTEEYRKMIKQAYNDMKEEKMWRLSTGKYVEKELFEIRKKLKFEHTAHSFILDVDDEEMMFDDNYDHEKYYNKDYIIYALYLLLRKIQNGKLKDTNLEAWFNCHVWNAIFDQVFGDLNAISVVRGESTSLISALRKNAKSQTGERRKMGCRSDWILRSTGSGDRD